jgi:hypothetical protein
MLKFGRELFLRYKCMKDKILYKDSVIEVKILIEKNSSVALFINKVL